YSTARGVEFYRAAVDRLAASPGVTSAAIVERLPFSPNVHTTAVFIDGRSYRPNDRGAVVDSTGVSPGYFRTMGVPIVKGREFDDRDTPSSPLVAIVNRTMAERYWPGQDPIGKRLRLDGPSGEVYEVVGVSGDHKVRTIGEPPRPYIHFAN